MTTPNHPTPSNHQAVVDLLGKIMALPEGERTALRSAWHAMDPASAAGTTYPGTVSGEPGDTGAQDELISPEDLAKNVGAWIDSLKRLPPEEQLEKLETALVDEDDEAVALQLQKAISAILNSNKKLAAKVALYRYAYDHPFMSIAGVLGLLGTVVLIAKGIMFKLF